MPLPNVRNWPRRSFSELNNEYIVKAVRLAALSGDSMIASGMH